MLVTLPLVPRGAGRRQQHHGRCRGLALRQRMRRIERRLEIAAAGVGNLAVELAGEKFSRLTDQKGVADAIEPRRERLDAALFRLAPQDPVDVAIGRQRPGRRVGVGCLAVVDIDDVADGCDALLTMRQASVALEAVHDPLARHVEPPAGRPSTGCILGIVVARQGRHVGEVDGIAVGIDQHSGAVGHAAGNRPVERHRHAGDPGARRHLALDRT